MTYQVFDHLWSEVVSIPVQHLCNPLMNIGLWYTETCTLRTDGLDLEKAIVRWLDGQEIGSTISGRSFEHQIEILLNKNVLDNHRDNGDLYD